MAVQEISSVNGLITAAPINDANVNKAEENVSFKELLMDAIKNVNSLDQESAKMTEDFIAGRTDDISSVMIAAEKASISLQFITEVRNKVMEAYQEIMRMQI
jgi:flagellar hook-basal body complex protein FliE